MMKRMLAFAVATVMALAVTACGGSTSSSSTVSSTAQGSSAPASSSAAALSGKVSTGGSTSVEKVIGALSEAFMIENSGVSVTYDPTGSGAGITGATEGTLDIGLSSRNLRESEAEVTGTVFALDGIAIVVNPSNPVENLTLEQIAGIATGEIKNWSEVGGADAEIVFYGREAGSGTRDGFESIVGVTDNCVYAEELTATGAIVGRVQTNENGIGYVSLASVKPEVKAVTVDGVAASEATVQDGTYAIQRPFLFVTNDSAAQSEAVKAFIDYALSAEAAEIIANAGAVPVK